MKYILMVCLLALCAACGNEDPKPESESCFLANWNLAHAPQLFLICERDIVAECFVEPIPTGFRWNGYYCRPAFQAP